MVPPTPVYQKWYYEPMEDWLREFTLDIEVDGEPFKPYDPTAPLRVAEYGASRGYDVPTDSRGDQGTLWIRLVEVCSRSGGKALGA